jgi:putative endonuclease
MFWPFGRHKPLGQRGEDLACRVLRRAKLKILARNYRCPHGEIDLIALDASTRKTLGAETIVFVEVKTRASDRYAGPEAAVDAHKRRQVRRAADYYLAHHATQGYAVRYDVVAIVLPEGGQPRIEHIPDAFRA